MATENVPVYNQYVGNGLATRFSIGFPYLDRDYVKVYIKRVGGVEEELTDDRYEFENDTTIVFPLSDDDDLLQDGDILTIQRETELGSDFEFDNQRRLFPEEVMHADDLSFQQIQELKRELDRAVKSRATDTITGPELYDSLQQQFRDVETKVGLAASSANMAQTWAEGTDSAVAELGGEHSSKEWATRAEALVGPLAPIAPQLAELANHVEELDTVAGSVDSVNTVADIAGQVVTLAAIDSDVMDVADNKDNIATVANNISGINKVAPNAQKIADANDNFEQLLKQINGEGDLDSIVSGNNVTQATSSVRGTARFATDAEAQAGTSTTTMITPKQLKQYSGGGGGSVDAYTKAETDEKLLLKQDKATAVNHDNITNCITEIPQDIKLEFNANTLTLKAGSKVYVPNGSGVFDSFTTSVDFSVTFNGNQKVMIFACKLTASGSVPQFIRGFSLNKCPSGATDSLEGTTYHCWYDTTNNIVNFYGADASTPQYYASLPIAIISVNNGVITSIDQVFNGFGYIGSTVFALPGVKGLIPNGRNEDGSLKNREFVNDRVRTFTATGSGYGLTYFLNPDTTNLAVVNTKAYVEKDTKLATFDNNGGVWFDTKQNIMLRTTDSGATWTRVNYVSFSYMFMTTAGNLDYLVSKTPFHAVDRNDSSWIAQQAMPSTRYIDLTEGASGANYTAPANGYVQVTGYGVAVDAFVEIRCNGIDFTFQSSDGRQTFSSGFIPVKKGAIFTLNYDAFVIQEFKFIYCEGEN